MNIRIKSIKSKKEFAALFHKGKRFYEKDAHIIIKYKEKPELETFSTLKIACSAGKRLSKKAVVRNRIKRLMRESLRAMISDPAFSIVFNKIDVIWIFWHYAPKRPSEIRLGDVEPTVRKLVTRILNK
jgi:ribonuclease P protein component